MHFGFETQIGPKVVSETLPSGKLVAELYVFKPSKYGTDTITNTALNPRKNTGKYFNTDHCGIKLDFLEH